MRGGGVGVQWGRRCINKVNKANASQTLATKPSPNLPATGWGRTLPAAGGALAVSADSGWGHVARWAGRLALPLSTPPWTLGRRPGGVRHPYPVAPLRPPLFAIPHQPPSTPTCAPLPARSCLPQGPRDEGPAPRFTRMGRAGCPAAPRRPPPPPADCRRPPGSCEGTPTPRKCPPPLPVPPPGLAPHGRGHGTLRGATLHGGGWATPPPLPSSPLPPLAPRPETGHIQRQAPQRGVRGLQLLANCHASAGGLKPIPPTFPAHPTGATAALVSMQETNPCASPHSMLIRVE